MRKVVGAFVVGCCVEGRNEGGEEVTEQFSTEQFVITTFAALPFPINPPE